MTINSEVTMETLNLIVLITLFLFLITPFFSQSHYLSFRLESGIFSN